jgi:hypothetical protein
VSTREFQIAITKLIASPQLCRETLVDEQSFFSGFELTEKEKMRLHAILRQKGMSACCSLYRMNRVTPVYTQLSNTSAILGEDLVPIISEFWNHLSAPSLQFREEVLEFGFFLMKKIDSGQVKIPYLKEVLKLEMAMNELSYLPEGEFRLLNFEHDIFQVLRSLAAGTLDTDIIDKSGEVYKMFLQNGEIQIDIL